MTLMTSEYSFPIFSLIWDIFVQEMVIFLQQPSYPQVFKALCVNRLKSSVNTVARRTFQLLDTEEDVV